MNLTFWLLVGIFACFCYVYDISVYNSLKRGDLDESD